MMVTTIVCLLVLYCSSATAITGSDFYPFGTEQGDTEFDRQPVPDEFRGVVASDTTEYRVSIV